MTNIITIFAYLTAGVNLLLGFLVLIKGVKRISYIFYFLLNISYALWAIPYAIWMTQFNGEIALFWARVLNFGATFIPFFYFLWIISFLNLIKQKKHLILFIGIITLLFLLFSFSNIYIKDVRIIQNFKFLNYGQVSWYWPQAGFLYSLFLIEFFGLLIYSLILLSKIYLKTIDYFSKQQIQFIIIGSLIGFLGGSTNFLLMYNLRFFPPIGMFIIFIQPIFFTIAILKYHLFNIKVIVTELLTFAIWIFIFIRILLAETLQETIINVGLLTFLIISGILLIRSVLKEVRMREKIEVLAKNLEEANTKLKQLDQAKTEFLSIASHQLRSPLTAIKGYSSMIMEGSYGAISEKIKETIDKIFVSSNRLVSIIEDFLDVSRIELGKMQYEFTDFDIREMINNLVEEFKANYKHQELELSFESKDAGKVMVNADFNKIRQVISNIIDNAMKYTDKGFVRVFLSQNPTNPPVGEVRDKILIAVKDSGRGMDKDDLGKIFQKFSRANGAAKSRTQGSGLGLYVANEMIKAHKGRVWAESEGIGKGSTFFVELAKNK